MDSPKSLFEGKLLQRSALVGTAMQVTVVVLAHYLVWFRASMLDFAVMMLSGLAGLFYAREFAAGYGRGALGGAIAGGTCGLIGISAANILGDVALIVLPFGTAITILTGAIGGLFGQMGANIRSKLNS
jgi:hypothetical protein